MYLHPIYWAKECYTPRPHSQETRENQLSTIRLGRSELKQNVDVIVSLELRQAEVCLLVLEGQRVVEHQQVFRMLRRDKRPRECEVRPAPVLHLGPKQ